MHGKYRTLKINFWPDLRNANPYQKLFYSFLEPYGVEANPGIKFSTAWIQDNRNNFDAIHIHWPEGIWRCFGLNAWKEPFHLFKLKTFLKRANTLDIGVIWTVHNIMPHDGERLSDLLGYRFLLKHCDLMIVHSDFVAEKLKKEKSADNSQIVVMQHGNYVDCYPAPKNREKVLQDNGLRTDLPVAACLGHIREYKGIEIAIEAIKMLGEQVQLIIAGFPHENLYISRIMKQIKDVPFYLLLPKILSSQEYADFSNASDFFLLPYHNITGSGTLLSAWSFGRCAIASDLPFFREEAKLFPGALKLFRSGNAESLAHVIKEHLLESNEIRNNAAIAAQKLTSWPQVIVPVAEALNYMYPKMNKF